MNRLFKKVIAAVMGLLGFAACDPLTIFEEPDVYGPGPTPYSDDLLCEYGTPMATFKFIGQATDEAGNPVEGIRIIVDPGAEYSPKDTLFTGEDGKAGMTLRYDWPDTNSMTVSFDDVDGEDNGGEFESQVLSGKDLTQEQTGEPSGNWYEGEFTITANAVLSKKSDSK